MAELNGDDPEKPADALKTGARQRAARVSLFKYYIHDSAEGLRLQLLGELTEHEVPELNGCWRTAKTTLRGRALLLDLRELKAVDEIGKQWLAGMADEGAKYLPETYLRTGLIKSSEASKQAPKLGLVARIVAMFRGSGVAAAE